QPPPPTIAEFAPQAVEQITDSPNDQNAAAGSGPRAGAAEASSAAATANSTVSVVRVRRCVGDPPRQIEDPQSPPCVPYWQGDNGGATSKGVTRDEIRIEGNYYASPDDVAFFNRRFEFYGRHITLVPVADAYGLCDASGERAEAARVDEEVHAFA